MSDPLPLAQASEPSESTPRPRRRTRSAARPQPGPPGQRIWLAGGLGLALLIMLLGVLSTQPVETIPNVWHPTRVLVYGLLFAGPGLLFWAMSRGLGLGLFWLFGTISWAALGAVLIFWGPPPRAAAGPGDYMLVLGLGFLALTALFTPPLAWLHMRLAGTRFALRDGNRPVRQAVLLALGGVAGAALLAFGVLNWLNLLLLFTVLALAEFFFLSRT